MKKQAFIRETSQLINLFSGKNELSYEQSKWFGDPDYPACKAMGAFMADIENDLEEWACDKNSIYYRTKKYWYIFELEDGVIVCQRFQIGTSRNWSTWMNVHSCSVGKKFLMEPEQEKKLVSLYNTNN